MVRSEIIVDRDVKLREIDQEILKLKKKREQVCQHYDKILGENNIKEEESEEIIYTPLEENIRIIKQWMCELGMRLDRIESALVITLNRQGKKLQCCDNDECKWYNTRVCVSLHTQIGKDGICRTYEHKHNL